jgi:hypothetical protein
MKVPMHPRLNRITKTLFGFGKSNIPQYHHECVPYGHASHGHTFHGHDLMGVYLTGMYLMRMSHRLIPHRTCISLAYVSCARTL